MPSGAVENAGFEGQGIGMGLGDGAVVGVDAVDAVVRGGMGQ